MFEIIRLFKEYHENNQPILSTPFLELFHALWDLRLPFELNTVWGTMGDLIRE